LNGMSNALALLEFDSVASGLRALDILVKEAPIEVLEANLVEPGKFLVLYVGGVAEVESSHTAVLDQFQISLRAQMLLPMVHSALVAGLQGADDRQSPKALGVIEGADVANTLVAADRSLKDADVHLVGIRVAVGLGGRAYYVLRGALHDVEAGVEVGTTILKAADRLHRTEVIARPHDEMVPWLLRPAPFSVG